MRKREDMGPVANSGPVELHRTFRPALMAFFLRRINNHAEAEDLTQEVFSRLAGSEQASTNAQAYIFQIAANLLRDRHRRDKVRVQFADGVRATEDAGVDTLNPHRIAVSREALALVIEGLDELPERSRQIFLLFRYEKIDRRSIAETFGISVSAVDKHIYRAMTKLMTKMGPMS